MHRKPCHLPPLHPQPLAEARVNFWRWADRPYPGTALQECLLSFLGGRSSRSSRECVVVEGGPCQAPSSMNVARSKGTVAPSRLPPSPGAGPIAQLGCKTLVRGIRGGGRIRCDQAGTR